MAPDADLNLYASSRGIDPGTLRPGRDLVLEIPARHGIAVQEGVLVDDHLDRTAREGIDQGALEALTAWRLAHGPGLRFGAVDLADLWHTELFGEVFLPVLRVTSGVVAAVHRLDPAGLVTHGLDPELVSCLQSVLASLPVTVGQPGALQRYPTEDAAPPSTAAAAPRWQRLARAGLNAASLPSVARGDVAVIPYGSTAPIVERLAECGPRPILYAAFPPPAEVALRAARRRGGWIGLPGWRARASARRALMEALARLEPTEGGVGRHPAVDALLHRRALRCLRDRAVDNLALARMLERHLRRRRPLGVIVPFDHEPAAKALVRAAQRRGVPVICLQHGYEPRKHFHPGEFSDAIGEWTQSDLDALPEAQRRRARVVGNPARGAVEADVPADRRTQHAVVLVEHHSRLSALIDRRITARHLAIAVNGLALCDRSWRVTVRPHPADSGPEFRALVGDLGGSEVAVDNVTPILELLGSAELCVGAISTAALQCALTGTRLVMLRLPEVDCLPPLDGSGAVPVAATPEELAAAVQAVVASPSPPGEQELLTALGHGPPDPTSAVLDWLVELNAAQLG